MHVVAVLIYVFTVQPARAQLIELEGVAGADDQIREVLNGITQKHVIIFSIVLTSIVLQWRTLVVLSQKKEEESLGRKKK